MRLACSANKFGGTEKPGRKRSEAVRTGAAGPNIPGVPPPAAREAIDPFTRDIHQQSEWAAWAAGAACIAAGFSAIER